VALAPFTDSANLPSLLAEAQESDSRAADVETAPDHLDLTPESVSKAEGSTVDELKSPLLDTRPASTAPIPPIVETTQFPRIGYCTGSINVHRF
jgi:hypothetical protein